MNIVDYQCHKSFILHSIGVGPIYFYSTSKYVSTARDRILQLRTVCKEFSALNCFHIVNHLNASNLLEY